MIGTGKNVGDLRRSNNSLILKLLYYEGAQSRKMLAGKAALTPAAVTTLTNELVEKGIIVDSDVTVKSYRAGRTEQYIDINYSELFIIGLRIEKQTAEIRIYNLGLKCVGCNVIELESFSDAEFLFEMLCDKIAFLMVNNGIVLKRLLGIGVSIKGIVDPVGGISVDSFGLIPNHTDIRGQIESRLHLPVSVDNNVRSMLMAESAIKHYNQGVSHLFIKYGPGVGAAFSIGQQTYNGVNYRAMELGHVAIRPEDGEICRCGRRGCLETIVSYKTIFHEAQELLNETANQKEIDLEALCQCVSEGNQPIIELFRRKFTLFARCLESCAAILDPQMISVCSDIFQYEPFREMFLKCIAERAKAVEGRLVLNPESEKIEQVGAAALVIHSFLDGSISR